MLTPVRLGAGSSDDVPAALHGGAVVIGNFDGVHRGHQALIGVARSEARVFGKTAVALTFEPHPRSVLRADVPLFRLTPEPAKLRILDALEVGGVVVAGFDRTFASLGQDEFVSALVQWLKPRVVVVGADFRFGRGRAGDVASLAAAGSRHGFAVKALAKVGDETGEIFSSGRAREELAAGDVVKTNAILGYRWFVLGTVIHGDKRGRELGYPTANISLPKESALRYGIYAVTAALPGGPALPAVASFGRRPTFGGGEPLLEVHVFDFASDLYGKTLTVTFLEYLRGEEKFASIEALIRQMDDDSRRARAIVAGAGPGNALDVALAARL